MRQLPMTVNVSDITFFLLSAPNTSQAISLKDYLQNNKNMVQETLYHNATSKDLWMVGGLEARFPGWIALFLPPAAEGIPEAEMVTILGDLRRSVTRRGQVALPKTGTTTVTDTTIHTATGHHITLPTIPDHTTDPRITVAPTTNILDRTRGAPTITHALTTRGSDGTIITEVIPVTIRPKVGITRIVTGPAI